MNPNAYFIPRLIRFGIWAILMLATCYLALNFAPHRLIFIPSLFLLLFVPMVILPIHRKVRIRRS